jgi:anti-sigma factor RsiW
MNRQRAEEHLSEYLEGELARPEREALEREIQKDPALAREKREMEKTLLLLRSLPRREPLLDIWMELAPKIAQVREEEKLNLADRLRLRGTRFLASFAEGAILWTQALAINTEARMGKYVHNHPLERGAQK